MRTEFSSASSSRFCSSPDFPEGQRSTALRGADLYFTTGQRSTALREADAGLGLQNLVPEQGSTHFVEPVFKISFQNRVHRRRPVEMNSALVGNAMSWMTAVCTGAAHSLAKRLRRTRTT